MLTLSSGLQGISGSFWFVLCPAMFTGGLINNFGTDPQKREIYDRSGGDPESRFSGMSSSGPSSGFPTNAFGGAAFEGELSPEDLFNMFFGGGPAFGAGGPGELSCRAHGTNIRSDCHPQCLPPALDLGVFAQPVFIHIRNAHDRKIRNRLLRGLFSFSSFLSSSCLHSPYSLLSRTYLPRPLCLIHAFHSKAPRDTT